MQEKVLNEGGVLVNVRVTHALVERTGRSASRWFFDIRLKRDELLQEDILSYRRELGLEHKYLLDINIRYFRMMGRKALIIKNIKKEFAQTNDYCLSVYYIPSTKNNFSIRIVLLEFSSVKLDITKTFSGISGLVLSFDLHLKDKMSAQNVKTLPSPSSNPAPEEKISLRISPDQSEVEIEISGITDGSWRCNENLFKYSKRIKNDILVTEISLVRTNNNVFNIGTLSEVKHSVTRLYHCKAEISIDDVKKSHLKIMIERKKRNPYPINATMRFSCFLFRIALKFPKDCSKALYSEKENQEQVAKLEKLRAFRRKSIESGIDFSPNELVTIYLYRSRPFCTLWGHNIESVNAIIHTVKGTIRQTSIGYCKDCEMYYMAVPEYSEFRNRYGAMLVHLNCDEVFGIGGNYAESKLHFLGYHVGQTGLSDSQRRILLKLIIETGIMEKRDIIDHLIYLLGRFCDVSQKRVSCQHWRADMEFLKSYEAENQRTVEGVLKDRASRKYNSH